MPHECKHLCAPYWPDTWLDCRDCFESLQREFNQPSDPDLRVQSVGIESQDTSKYCMVVDIISDVWEDFIQLMKNRATAEWKKL